MHDDNEREAATFIPSKLLVLIEEKDEKQARLLLNLESQWMLWDSSAMLRQVKCKFGHDF